LSLFTSLGYINLEKIVLRCPESVRDAFFWPGAAFARLYRLSTDASKATSIGYDADAGVPYPFLCIFFFTAGDDGMIRNGLQEKVAYPTRGDLMESKIK
jgi:hypothetical protein